MAAETLFKKILIANRGEIAVRIIRACKELQIPTVAVFSEADRSALHVRIADEAYCIGNPPAGRSYMKGAAIIAVAKSSGCDAIHPGYGFLAEQADFAEQCAAAGITFIGPNPHALRVMGNKPAARALAAELGLPLLSGMQECLADEIQAHAWGATIGFPLMVKAADGYGGKAIRKVERSEDLAQVVRAVTAEARNSFGSSAVYLERYLDKPRHVEIQLLGDKQGHLIHLMERECSIQRRHQKMIEEAPAPFVDDDLRRRLGEAAVRIASAVGYDSVGTVEFLVSATDGDFYFLEMTPRLAVEHPVTEAITGTDLCKEMIRVAAGMPLTLRQEEIQIRGHAIQCRVYAEDSDHDFFPTEGRISCLRVPGGPGVRDDSGIYEGFDVPVYYNPPLAKLVIWAGTRERCISRSQRALSEYIVKGVKTTIPFCERVLNNEHFMAGDYDTTFLNTTFVKEDAAREKPHQDVALLAAAITAFRRDTMRSGANSGVSDTTVSLAQSAWKMSGRVKR